MNRHTLSLVLAAFAGFAGFGQANATELPDCQIESGTVTRIMERVRSSSDTMAFLNVAGPLRSGTDVAYAKDDAVLAVDLKVTQTYPVLIPSGEIYLKTSWPLSPNFRFEAKAPLTANLELQLPDGRQFRVFRMQKSGMALFLNDQDRFCNKAVNTSVSPRMWALGTLSQESPDVTFERNVLEEQTHTGSMRIIFNGISSGQMSFQEIWVNGAIVMSSKVRNFDQFAKTIKIPPFQFDVVAVANGTVTLRYDIGERMPAAGLELGRLPMTAFRQGR